VNRLVARYRAHGANDAGVGVLLVVGMTMVLMMLSVVALGIVRSSLSSSNQHVRFEAAIAVAEVGIDRTLARVQQVSTYTACACTTPAFTTEAAERQWAQTQITTQAAAGDAALTTDGQGQYLAIRPSNRQVIYSMSWVPSYAAFAAKAQNSKRRLIKAEYLFAPYQPDSAILTQGNLNFSGSVLVDATAPADAAGVHTNGSVTGNSSLTVKGQITSSGSYDVGGATVEAGSGGNQPLKSVPAIRPREIYESQTSFGGSVAGGAYDGFWYDLCPDGLLHGREPTQIVPCAGPAVGSPALGTSRGWNFAPASVVGGPGKWSMDEASSPFGGIYYALQADVEINGKTRNGDPPWRATVFAEAGGTGCTKVGGDISWKLTDIQNFIPGLVLIAGRDLHGSANNDAGDGLFGAAEQIYLKTSSAALTGYLIASDECPDPANPSEVQGVTLKYDRTAESPIKSVVRTTLWLEYAG